MAGSEVKVELPNDIITSIVRAQIVAALGKSEQLVEGVVKAALDQKRNTYDRTTLFEEQVAEMIRREATTAFSEWLQENKEKVRAELRKQLTAQKGKLVTDLVDNFTKSLTNIYPQVTIKFPNHE